MSLSELLVVTASLLDGARRRCTLRAKLSVMNVQAASRDKRRERRGKVMDLTEQVMCPGREARGWQENFAGDAGQILK